MRYAAGPLLVGFGYQDQKAQNAATTVLSTSSGNTKYTLIAGSYDFGVAKAFAHYGQNKSTVTTTGADVNKASLLSDTPFVSASTRVHADVVDQLVAAGANISLANKHCDVPLF